MHDSSALRGLQVGSRRQDQAADHLGAVGSGYHARVGPGHREPERRGLMRRSGIGQSIEPPAPISIR